ncbi:hypothetical protein KUIN1_26920 [Pseudomonas sp. KUIN-1]|nr:hypothetical protein KUIN1_26920 [Pseudomonas sp. KUIN-1]
MKILGPLESVLPISSDRPIKAASSGTSQAGDTPKRLFRESEAPTADAETEPERSDILSSETPTRGHADD